MHQKLAPDPVLILLNNPTAIACKKFFLKEDILKEDYRKAFKKLILFFLSNPVPFNGRNYQRKGKNYKKLNISRTKRAF